MDEQRSPLKGELNFLERLSMEELEALLKFSGDPDDVELLFDTVVEEVVAREKENPTGRLPDVDSAWDELQMMYHNMPDAETIPLSSLEKPVSLSSVEADPAPLAEPAADKPRRVSFQKVMRTAAVMAAAIVLCLALMVGVQAAGADVFGALAQWTDDTFHFDVKHSEDAPDVAGRNDVIDVLSIRNVLGKYAPTQYPDGFDIANVQIVANEYVSSTQVSLSNNDGRVAYICVDKYSVGQDINLQTFELESESVTEYFSNGKIFYLFSNSDVITAVWSDSSTLLQRIWGDLTESELKSIIDSIGE